MVPIVCYQYEIQDSQHKRQDQEWKVREWTESDTEEVEALIKEIKRNILLVHADYSKPFEIYTDACQRGIGAIIIQNNQILGIYSGKLSKAESNYSVCKKEMLAIFKALNYFKTIIYNGKITVMTDNRNITYLKNYENGRITRWMWLLNEMNVEIKHVSGKENIAADTLSRQYLILESEETADIAEENKKFFVNDDKDFKDQRL